MAFQSSDRMLSDATQWATTRIDELQTEIESLINLFPALSAKLRLSNSPLSHTSPGIPLEMAHDAPGHDIEEEEPQEPITTFRKPGGWSKAQRAKVSQRMKRYWAARKREQKSFKRAS
jgi:hypothetical protein